MNTLASGLTLAAFAMCGLFAVVAAVSSDGERVEAMSAISDSEPERLIDVAAHMKTRVAADAKAQVKDTVVEVAKEAVDAATVELHRAVDSAAERSLESVRARLDAELGVNDAVAEAQAPNPPEPDVPVPDASAKPFSRTADSAPKAP